MEDQQISSHKSELWSLSVKDIFYKYVRFLPLFLLSLAFALLVAWVYLRYSTRIYSATGTMLIKSEQGARSDKVEDMITGSNRTGSIQNEIEVLKSRPLMTRVVKKLNLEFSYTAIGKIKEYNIYKQGPFLVEAFQIKDSTNGFSLTIKFLNADQFRINGGSQTYTLGQMFESAAGVFRLTKTAFSDPGGEYRVTWEPSEKVAASIVNGVKVQPKIPGTGILSISLQSTNGQLAADIINGLMIEYDSMTVEQNNYSTDQTLSFIDGRLDNLGNEIDSIQAILLAYQQRNDIIDAETQSNAYYERITEADRAINEQTIQVNVAEMISEYLADKRNAYARVVVPSSLGLQDATLNDLVIAYNAAQIKRQSLIDGGIPPANPSVVEAEGLIEKLRESILENLVNVRSAYTATIEEMKKRGAAEQSQLKALPYKLKEYTEIQRQLNTKLALYTILEEKREEAAISRAATISNSKVLDKALSSDTPVKPNKRTIQILAILLGIGFPALIIFIGEVINDKVTTRFDIEKITNASILGEVGHSYSDKTLIVNKSSRSMVAEQFRIIRSNLQYLIPKTDKPVILVTSSFSGEGKSFVSTNMGAVLALTGKKTIILEFDIRKPKVMSGLHLTKKSGISNFLVGKANLDELIIQVPDHENLWVLPCGPIPPNPSELLLDAKVSELFVWMREHFDVILIDTAPVGMVSDAMTLGKFADCTLYLVRQGHTFKKQVTLIDELYRSSKLPKISIIINDVKVKPGYGYYGYGRYGYGYGYGYGQKSKDSSYYEEEKPPDSALDRLFEKLNPRKWFRKR
jgi:tyrosine-protein kinase Etk/Wzc